MNAIVHLTQWEKCTPISPSMNASEEEANGSDWKRWPVTDLMLLLTDISLVLAGHAVTQPEIRFVNSVVEKHLVSTFRADWLLFQALNILIRESASSGATEPIYGLRDDG